MTDGFTSSRNGGLAHSFPQTHLGCPTLCGFQRVGYRSLSSGSGALLGAVRRYFINPSPVAFPARFLKKSDAVSMTPTFSATATAIHWLSDTPSSFASRCAAFLMERGSFNG